MFDPFSLDLPVYPIFLAEETCLPNTPAILSCKKAANMKIISLVDKNGSGMDFFTWRTCSRHKSLEGWKQTQDQSRASDPSWFMPLSSSRCSSSCESREEADSLERCAFQINIKQIKSYFVDVPEWVWSSMINPLKEKTILRTPHQKLLENDNGAGLYLVLNLFHPKQQLIWSRNVVNVTLIKISIRSNSFRKASIDIVNWC